MALVSENPEFVTWREAWQACPRQWWRIALVFIAFFVGLTVVGLPASTIVIPWLKSSFPAVSPLLKELIQIVLVGLSFIAALLTFLWSMQHLHGKSPSVIASRRSNFRKSDALKSGIFWLILFVIGEVSTNGSGRILQRLETYELWQWLILSSTTLLCIGVQATTEEIIFRGYLLPVLASRVNLLAAIAISIFIFIAGHPGSGVWGTLAVTIFASTFTLATLRTGTLSFGAGAHVANNFAMFLLFPKVTNAQGTITDVAALAAACVIWMVWIEHTLRRRATQEYARF